MTRRNFSRIIILLWIGGALIATGCARPAAPGKCKIAVRLQATKDINLDREGKALPTPVRFYQLKGIGNLREATFESMWTDAEATLGDDYIEMVEVVVYPGQRHQEFLNIKEDTVFIAAAAIFREPEGVKWRTFTRLPDIGTIERCAEETPGGPYYFLLEGSSIRGSNKVFKIK